MKIDYFCFSVPSLESTDYDIKENDDENTIWIKTKEQELMDEAKKHNRLILFDRTTKKFYIENQEMDIANKIIFPRSFLPYEEELLIQLQKHGALSIQTNDDIQKIEHWPQKIQPLHRKVIQTTYQEFQLHLEDYQSIFKNIFLKTAKKTHIHAILKSYGFVDFCGKKLFVTKPNLWGISLNDTIFLSEAFQPMEDVENNMDCKEYRAFILNHHLLSISRSYIDYPTEVPKEVKLFVENQINQVASISDFPDSYVLDVGQILMNGKEVIDIIEYNPISSSGLEVCNRLVEEIIQLEPSPRLVKKRFYKL